MKNTLQKLKDGEISVNDAEIELKKLTDPNVDVFKEDAKRIVDVIFESGMLKSNITRDEMNATEDLIRVLIKMKFESHVMVNEFMKKADERKSHD